MLRSTTASVFTDFPATFLACPAGRTVRKGSAAPAATAQAHLASRAEIGRTAGDDDPRDRAAAIGAGLALAGVDEELILHPALLAAAVTVVVDRGAAVGEPCLERLDHGVAQGELVLRLHRAGRRKRG